MCDLETLGTSPGCAVLSIAIVPFDIGYPIEPFYERISRKSCEDIGLEVDPQTELWWQKQSAEARDEAFGGTADIESVLHRVTEYIKTLDKTPVMWGNGASFDIPILEEAFYLCDMTTPWHYTKSLCYRTMKNIYKQIPYLKPQVAHNALQDAKAQAAHLERIFQFIRSR
jgi:DNA polymerase III epsilon subunit-like protein